MIDQRDPGRRRAAYDEYPRDLGRFGGDRGPRRRGGRDGFGGPPRRSGGGRGRGRARRGDVRIAILLLLAERPMHGYEMIQELGERTGGAWTPSPGSVYPTLTLLEEEGQIRGEEVDGKRRFVLTDAGTEAKTAHQGPAPWTQVVADADPAALALRETLGSTMAAVQQVFRVGTPAQQDRAVAILTETRRQLYEVLAGEG